MWKGLLKLSLFSLPPLLYVNYKRQLEVVDSVEKVQSNNSYQTTEKYDSFESETISSCNITSEPCLEAPELVDEGERSLRFS